MMVSSSAQGGLPMLDSRLRTTGLLSTLLVLSACQTADTIFSRPQRDPTVPSKVATRAPSTGGSGRPTLTLDSAQGAPGDTVSVAVKLSTGGAGIAGTQNDIVFDPKQVSVPATAKGKPDCAANRQLGKEGTAFSFVPANCRPGTDCTAVRALVLSLSNVDAIPNGSTLYTCRVRVAAQASPGTQKLSVTRVGFSSPSGQAIDGVGKDGAVTVAK
jgi:hypothetical protein